MKKVMAIILTVVIATACVGNYLFRQSVDAKSKQTTEISNTDIEMTVGEVFKLEVKGKKISKVIWKSSDKKLASVDKNGRVIAKKQGNVVITAKVKVGGKIAKEKHTCDIIISSKMENEKARNETLKRTARLIDAFESDSNILVSPISLNMVLGMAANSGDKTVRKQVEQYLGTDIDAYNEYMFSLIKYSKKHKTFTTANSIWYDKAYKLRKNFKKNVTRYYRAGVHREPMNRSTIKKINRWAERKTDGMIKKAMEDDGSKKFAIVLNASFFDGKWTKKFKKEDTMEEDFTNADGTLKTVDMMNSKEGTYFENDYATAFEKTYGKNKEYSFIGILPKKIGQFTLEEMDLPSLMKSMVKTDVLIKMPRMDYEWDSDDKTVNENNLTEVLNNLKMPALSKCNILKNFHEDYETDFLQKTKIKVDENGTKAAAVTVMFMKVNGVLPDNEPKRVYLDRPFAFFIRDNETGEILFIGKYMGN